MRLGGAAQVKQEGNRHVSDLQGQGSETHGNGRASLSLHVLFCLGERAVRVITCHC